MVTHKILVLGFLVRVQMVQLIELLQQNAIDIDIEVLTNATEKYNKLSEELTILNSYKTIFGIN